MSSLAFFERHLDDYLSELRDLVEIETPTRHLEGLTRAAAFLTELLSPLAEVGVQELDGFGPVIRARRAGRGSRLVVLAHYDTVWPVGSWPEPWRRAGGRIFGPGVNDMKGGLLFIPWMLRCLDATGGDHPDIEILLNPDEEVGSLGSKPVIDEAASRADFALVLESVDARGSLALTRKGSGDFFVHIHGRAAHQGAEPELGVNAVHEAAHQVLRLIELADPERGTTLGPNVISGGTAPNIVADRADISVDVRAWTLAEQRRLEAAIRGLQPVLHGARIEVAGQWNRAPMEATAASRELCALARARAADLGIELDAVAWGGASDANIAAQAGAATLDGFGPLGEGAHQPGESIVVDALPPRQALFTELVRSLAEPPEAWLSREALEGLRSRHRPRVTNGTN